jgi:proteic killer suppression protein
LVGNRQGQYSIRVNSQWRICFRWSEGHAEEAELVD